MDIIDKLRHPSRCQGDEYQSLGNLCHEAANIIEVVRRTLLETCQRETAKDEDNKRLRETLEPFAEIAKRNGWTNFVEDAPGRCEHIVEAPADDIATGAVYCCTVENFIQAAKSLVIKEQNNS